MAFNLQDYDPVENRIHEFWKQYGTGRIISEIILINETEIVIKTSVYTDRDDQRPASIGFAQESRKTDPISFAEKCETSSIGRALANLGFSPNLKNKQLRASREEMEKVSRAGSLHVIRDWELELTNLAQLADVDGLRELRKDAVRSLQPKDLIGKIDAAGKALALPDTPEKRDPAGTQKPAGSGVE